MSLFGELANRILNDDYDVRDDVDEMQETRYCANCGRAYTIEDAESEFYDAFNGDLSYNVLSELCGSCAIDEQESKF